jgi:hypothetical protein
MNNIYFNRGLINMQQIGVKIFQGIFCDIIKHNYYELIKIRIRTHW